MVRGNGRVGAGASGCGWVRRIGVCVVGIVANVREGIVRCERLGHVIVLKMLLRYLCLVVGLVCAWARWFFVALVLVVLGCLVVSCDLLALFQVVSTQ